MIGYIKGTLEEIEEQYIIVENQGIGYQIFVPGTSFSGSVPVGEEVKVYTYLHVKEDLLQLYGFPTRDELQIFKLLLGVNGIGPKAGLGILSALSADELTFAILADDVTAISRAPGIGKKTAQKLILNLEEAFEQRLAGKAPDPAVPVSGDSIHEAVQALTALGYGNADALRAVKKVEGAEQMDVEELLKAALKRMI